MDGMSFKVLSTPNSVMAPVQLELGKVTVPCVWGLPRLQLQAVHGLSFPKHQESVQVQCLPSP